MQHETRGAGVAGRPALAERLRPEEVAEIRRLALGCGLGGDRVSLSLGVRLYAQRPDAPEWLREWAAGRASKCYLPPSLREALAVEERVVARLTAPGRERLRYEGYAPGSLRMIQDQESGKHRLARAGEAEVWDDATVNSIFWSDGPIAQMAAERGDRCAQRFGVVVGRWQLLLGVDVRSDWPVGWQWVIRERASYRQTDPLAAWAAVWGQVGRPVVLVTERGTWEADRIQEALAIWHVDTIRSYHPRTKLVENVFGRLWTRLGALPASVGRGRAENEVGDRLLRQCRAGSVDPRDVCLSMGEMDRRLTAAAVGLAQEAVESRHYGRWVPAEVWAAEASGVRRPLDQRGPDGWAALPERRALKIRRGGMVQCQVDTGWGHSEVFAWGGAEWWRWEGREVHVYFDPAAPTAPAVVVDAATRAVLDAQALPLAGDGAAGGVLRRMQSAAVRREARVLRPDGTLAAWRSEVRDGAGRVRAAAMASGDRPAADPAPAAAPAVEQWTAPERGSGDALARRLEGCDADALDDFLGRASMGLAAT